ncbi:MAG: T9SS type A sorting domain-containing protein [Bacteroidales bacterium]|nr:T9SS type A sorting domain-containing protein [Bacteroidales bacterium]
MRIIIFLFFVVFIQQILFAQWDRTFTPDTGFRITDASIPRIFQDSTNYVYYLYYVDQGGNPPSYQTSIDGLNFSNALHQPNIPVLNDTSFLHSPKVVDCHNNTYRKYWYSNDTMHSATSTDRMNFTLDAGYSYVLDTSDNGSKGVDDFFLLGGDSIMYIYIGDLYGRNNCRIALSTNNGQSFTFISKDPLGDYNNGGGANTYVDPKITKISPFEYRLFTMKGGNALFSFYTADGFNYTFEGQCLNTSSFTQFNSTSLNDPHVIHLSDGRYRMYVASFIDTGSSPFWAIVSAISEFPPTAIRENDTNALHVFPNPASDYLKIQLPCSDNKFYPVEIFSLDGKILYKNEIQCVSGELYVQNLFAIPNGYYLVSIILDQELYSNIIQIQHP